jgi:sugar phosphate isomerase/epimerase
MKVGIDSYCYHRFFGEVYPEQVEPSTKMTLEDFLKRAGELEVDGVSLESCFVPRLDTEYLAGIKSTLDEYKLDRVWAWGHPEGLEGGTNREALDDLHRNLEHAVDIGAKVMRVVGSSLTHRFEPHGPQIERLSKMFSEVIGTAEKMNVKMAVENHMDFNSDEMLNLIKNVSSPYLGINFDTGNFLRLLDDPVKGMEKLAKHVYSTHVKDLLPRKDVPADEWYFFSCAPVGDGLVDNQRLARILKENGYEGFLAVEIDFLHPDYNNDEDGAVEKSVRELKRIAAAVDK